MIKLKKVKYCLTYKWIGILKGCKKRILTLSYCMFCFVFHPSPLQSRKTKEIQSKMNLTVSQSLSDKPTFGIIWILRRKEILYLKGIPTFWNSVNWVECITIKSWLNEWKFFGRLWTVWPNQGLEWGHFLGPRSQQPTQMATTGSWSGLWK